MTAILRRLALLATLLAVVVPALAAGDPAARVGRIALLDGPTLFRTDRDDAGSPASLNWPVTSGAILDTERGSRAEIWIGSTAYRLAGDSRLEFSSVDDRLVTAQLAVGTLAITIRDRDQADDVEIRTPNGRVQFGGPGRYRIDVGNGGTNVAAVSGTAYVYAGERTVTVDAGRTASIDPGGNAALYGESLHDAFDDWAAQRDAASRPRTAQRYVSPATTGYQDLDAYGDWGSVPDYGTIWYPRAMPVGWAPYRYGRWAWIPPWGWTWVDAAPWGFTPFHYGRWVEIRGRWGWVPGAYAARPVYAPALVAWIGNPGWSLTLSVGSGPAVGWFPLAPREVYVPAYRTSPTYIRQVNVTHVTNVTVIERAVSEQGRRHFAYRDSPRAVTVVPANALREGAPIRASNWSGRNHRELRDAPVSARAPEAGWIAPATAAARPGPFSGRDGERRDSRPGATAERPPVRQGAPDMTSGRSGERNNAPVGGHSERNPAASDTDRRQPQAAPRPLPPGIDRLPPERQSGRETSPPVAQERNVAPQTAPEERPRGESRPWTGSPPERRGDQPSRQAMPQPVPERPPVATPRDWRNERPPPAASEPPRQREMAQPAPVMRAPQPQTMPAPIREPQPMERRHERPAPAFNEPPRQREVPAAAPAMRMPQPQATPTPAREPQQIERRGPPPGEERGQGNRRHEERPNRQEQGRPG